MECNCFNTQFLPPLNFFQSRKEFASISCAGAIVKPTYRNAFININPPELSHTFEIISSTAPFLQEQLLKPSQISFVWPLAYSILAGTTFQLQLVHIFSVFFYVLLYDFPSPVPHPSTWKFLAQQFSGPLSAQTIEIGTSCVCVSLSETKKGVDNGFITFHPTPLPVASVDPPGGGFKIKTVKKKIGLTRDSRGWKLAWIGRRVCVCGVESPQDTSAWYLPSFPTASRVEVLTTAVCPGWRGNSRRFSALGRYLFFIVRYHLRVYFNGWMKQV